MLSYLKYNWPWLQKTSPYGPKKVRFYYNHTLYIFCNVLFLKETAADTAVEPAPNPDEIDVSEDVATPTDPSPAEPGVYFEPLVNTYITFRRCALLKVNVLSWSWQQMTSPTLIGREFVSGNNF